MNLYTVYDKIADEAGHIFEQVNDGTAMRAYRRLFADGQANDREYKLLYLGTFDKRTCKIVLEEIPKEIYVPEVESKKKEEGVA